ncbi:unnamed protein product [Pleuronectes platessa]|uniref:Uncharacterized protein n=1 Tax=Pleuronectes platessa TaxID=8262 RepID=A0A9N7Z5B8_PLEPL|nr:unnamed protein product [Pleuronectes platessa]
MFLTKLSETDSMRVVVGPLLKTKLRAARLAIAREHQNWQDLGFSVSPCSYPTTKTELGEDLCQNLESHSSVPSFSLCTLPLAVRIHFKTLVLADHAANGSNPVYIQDMVKPYIPAHLLRSSSTNQLAITARYS